MLEIHLRQVILFHVVPDGVEVTLNQVRKKPAMLDLFSFPTVEECGTKVPDPQTF